ncbi:MAG TPA: c-type cytochrome [Myxococcota bacterium]|nr:c-type cytochrome [Myxococcota bacterium]
MAMRIGARAGAVATAVLLCGAAFADPPADKDASPDVDMTLAEMGKPYFQAYCASCHGVSGRGDGPASVSLRARPADLTQIAARRGGKFSRGEIAQFIDGRFSVSAHGSREMPVWGEVFTRDIPEADVAESIARGKVLVLVEYLKSIQAPAPKAEPKSRP